MKEKICLFMITCCLLSVMTVTCYATEASAAIPTTGDVTSIVALALVGVAAIGGFLLKRAK